jgi:hypothetical protein
MTLETQEAEPEAGMRNGRSEADLGRNLPEKTLKAG